MIVNSSPPAPPMRWPMGMTILPVSMAMKSNRSSSLTSLRLSVTSSSLTGRRSVRGVAVAEERARRFGHCFDATIRRVVGRRCGRGGIIGRTGLGRFPLRRPRRSLLRLQVPGGGGSGAGRSGASCDQAGAVNSNSGSSRRRAGVGVRVDSLMVSGHSPGPRNGWWCGQVGPRERAVGRGRRGGCR